MEQPGIPFQPDAIGGQPGTVPWQPIIILAQRINIPLQEIAIPLDGFGIPVERNAIRLEGNGDPLERNGDLVQPFAIRLERGGVLRKKVVDSLKKTCFYGEIIHSHGTGTNTRNGSGAVSTESDIKAIIMARKTVRVGIPENIDDLTTLIERVLLKNDGVLPALPGQPPTTPAGGSNALPTDLVVPLRTLYPELKQYYLELVAARNTVSSRTGSVQQKLGLAEGQTRATDGTGLNLVTRILKVLLGLYSGRENEAESWGFTVVVGSARVPQRTPPAQS